jgi:hypothetical protein
MSPAHSLYEEDCMVPKECSSKVQNVQFRLFSSECSFHNVQNVQFRLFSSECSVQNVHFRMFSSECSVQNVWFGMFSSECSEKFSNVQNVWCSRKVQQSSECSVQNVQLSLAMFRMFSKV